MSTTPEPFPEAVFTIPGTVAATIRTDPDDPTRAHVIRLAFTPYDVDPTVDLIHLEDAGLSAVAEAYAEAEHTYDPTETTGPFWSAMRRALAETTRFASMDDNDDDTTVTGPTVPIEWTE